MAEKEKDFKITSEEAAKIKKAMKDEEFRKLLTEYAAEISDPENRAKYEREITELERQRGVNIQFIHPTAGFVMKVFTKPEGEKTFINVCQNENVNKAEATWIKEKGGDEWMIPYSLTPPRDDLDKAGKKCRTIDAVFNPETYKKGQQNPSFKKLLIDTVLDGIEKNLHIPLDRKSLIFLRMPYKGVPISTVLRERTKDPYAEGEEGPDFGPLKVPYPPLKEELEAKTHKNQQEKKKQPNEPEYSIVHRGEMSMQDFTNDRTSSGIKRPKELVVTVHLPGVDSAKSVELDIFEKSLLLQCTKPLYKLDLALPYPIDEDRGSAKFNKSKKSLVITLPVLPLPHPPPLAPPTRPLVSELPDDEITKPTNGLAETESHDIKTEEVEDTKQEEGLVGVVQEVSKDWTSKGEWLCPPFTYRQDDSCVYFMLQTSGVKKSSMVSHFDEHQVQLTYSTTGGQKYSFSVSFPPRYSLDGDDCRVDISDENIVLVLAKNEESSDKEWDDFNVGLKSAQSKEEKLFLTADNVQSAVEKSFSSEEPWEKTNGWSKSAQPEVTSLSGDHMEVKVTDQERRKKPSPKASSTSDSSTEAAGEHTREKGSSVAATAERKPQSPSDGAKVEDKIESKSKPRGDEGKCKDSSTEPELDLVQEEKNGRDNNDSGTVAKDKTNSMSTRQETLADTDTKREEVVNSKEENDIQGTADTDVGKEMAASCPLEQGANLEPSGSNLLVEKDGSVFVRADKDYRETKPLEQMAKAKNTENESKIQFSNQLAFALD